MPVLDASAHRGSNFAHAIDRATYNNYYWCCTWIPCIGSVGALRALRLERYFGNIALFDLVQRAFRENNLTSGHGSPWADAMFAAYGDSPAAGQALCSNGAQNRCHPGGCIFNQTSPGSSSMFGEQGGMDEGAACGN